MESYIGVGLICAAVAAGGTWKVQDWRYDAKDKERIAMQLETERVAHIGAIHREEIVIKAQNVSTARAKKASDDAAAARNELDGVRSSADTALSRARVSHEACLSSASKLENVLLTCGREYEKVARDADRWENSAITLDEAWPTKVGLSN